MKTTKKNKEFAELVEQLTDLSQRDYRDAIRITRQFRRAQRMLMRTMERQQKEFILPKKSKAEANLGGLNYELQ